MGILDAPETTVQLVVPTAPLTETDSPTVSGRVISRRGITANCGVDFYIDGNYASSTTADANGNFSAVVGPLVGNGAHQISAAPKPAFKRTASVTLALAFNYVVDPTTGSDSNPGTPSQPWASLAPLNALPSIPTGSVIGIRRGSVFKQTLTRNENNLSFVGFGSSSAGPVTFEGADTITTGAWTLTSGQTNVYQCTITLPGNVKFSGNVWDSSSTTALVQTTSIANVAATPGSAYCSNWQGTTATLYVQLSDSSNPASNGRTISYSARTQGLTCNGNNITLDGMTFQHYGHQDGNIGCYGTGNTVRNFQTIGGNRHGALFGPSTSFSNAQFISGFDDLEGSANGVVIFAATVAGMTVTTQGNLYDGTWGRNYTGIDYHGASASDLFGTVTHLNETFRNMQQGVTSKATSSTITGATFTNVSSMVSLSGGTVTFQNCQPGSTCYNLITYNPSLTADVSATSLGNTFTIPTLGYSSLVAAYRSDVTASNFNLTINGDTVTIGAANATYDFIRVAKGALNVQNLKVLPALGNPAPRLYNLGTSVAAGGAVTLGTIDYNTYPFGTQFQKDGVLYSTLAAWQAATGKDMHSTVAQPVPSGSDSFQRADSYLDGTAPYVVIGTANQIGVRSNACAFLGTTQTVYSIPLSSVDHYVRCTVAAVPATGNAFPLAVRVIDQNNWIGARWSSGSKYQIYKCVSGTLTSIGSGNVAPAIGDDVVFVARGTRVYLYVNGVNVGGIVDITSTGLLTQKYIGMVARGAVQNPMLSYLEWGNAT
ncbi:hypothetical protein [Burkholderia vietnamiensis]|uniref:hypothetical protein n=1 Tax=Burkholderia vietnamiensis TaxID=60552 RepID=UPI001CAEBB8A|nr:hypothetical protein [Burkholderia vietnamiensis]CAG9226086.1 hypothetical protein BVI434_450125 [Burkholderia vietnamiensis]